MNYFLKKLNGIKEQKKNDKNAELCRHFSNILLGLCVFKYHTGHQALKSYGAQKLPF